MAAVHEGGCLCGDLRYRTDGQPLRVTICHCRFCQRATGSAYFVEPIFNRSDFAVLGGEPHTYDHVSTGSGKVIHVHFCRRCGTKLFLTFERFPDVVGVYGGTYDDPDWFDRSSATARHIFLNAAQRGVVIPPGVATYRGHATTPDGTPAPADTFPHPHPIGD